MPDYLIITPCMNAAKWLNETVLSVITQPGNFSLHYHVQDGDSNDGTIDILDRWDTRIRNREWPVLCNELSFSWSSEKDNNVYDGLNRGIRKFSRDLKNTTLMSWISTGDRLQQGALETVFQISKKWPDVSWLTGVGAQISQDGCVIFRDQIIPKPQQTLVAGLHEDRYLPFVQQEGTFWTHELWEAAGGHLNDELALAGDFELWQRFANHTHCSTLAFNTGYFRRHGGQLSENRQKYYAEVDRLLNGPLADKRDRVWRQLQKLAENPQNAHQALAQAGYVAPIIGPDSSGSGWMRALSPIQVPLHNGKQNQ